MLPATIILCRSNASCSLATDRWVAWVNEFDSTKCCTTAFTCNRLSERQNCYGKRLRCVQTESPKEVHGE